ncbi:unnamed protein product [Cochlearia groenlandica]
MGHGPVHLAPDVLVPRQLRMGLMAHVEVEAEAERWGQVEAPRSGRVQMPPLEWVEVVFPRSESAGTSARVYHFGVILPLL